MTSVFSPAKEMKPEEYKRVTEMNYLGYVYGTLAALRRMLPRNQGRIIQVGMQTSDGKMQATRSCMPMAVR